ncbi:MAG: B12-binding domain-containing radical SAM protein [Candidatus Gastranaerophilales bacterium]|nr:B12-binding domain-containing radical SAM protein [Candidatus Gastranaerophilales bacterium]
MKALFLFVPQWMPISPHYSLATLLGQFNDSPYKASVIDLNSDFYNKILKSNYVKNALKVGKNKLEEINSEFKKIHTPDKKFEDYSIEWQNKIAKSALIKDLISKYGKELDKTAILCEQAVKFLKSKEHFYNPKLYINAINTISLALEICSMPYYPTKIGLVSYQNQMLKLNYESIKYYVFDRETNIFYDYLEEKLEDILKENADYIGISINSSNQIIAGLTLASMLKKKTKAHISIGGNHFGRVKDSLEKYPEFFELFCDSVCLEEGEIPVYKLAQHIAGEIPIEQVPNLMYKKDDKIITNPIIEPLKLNDMKMASLNGYKLDEYFTPEIIMPFQTSRGCYWRKCSFCDHDFGMHYNIKDLDKLIEQIKYFKNNYGIKNFEFIDEAISPSYLRKMSERLIKEDLNISFFCDARLEDGFDEELMKLAHRAGLKMVLWGYESGSEKIMKLINKGINIENRLKILKNSHDAGIFNFAFIFFGFPAETKEDALMTIKDICENTDVINVYGKSVFTMGKHTKLREAPEKYGVIGETYQEAEFSPTYNYTASGMTKIELQEIINLCSKKAFEAYGDTLPFHLLTREYMLLYLTKYGTEIVCNYKF